MPISVNGKTIPDTAISEEMSRLHQEQQRQQQQGGPPPDQNLPPNLQRERLQREAVERVIGRELLGQEAEKRYPKVPADVVDKVYQEQFGKAPKDKSKQNEVDQQRSAIKRSLRVRRLLDELGASIEKPTDDDIFSLYNREIAAFSRPEAVHASHIVKHVNAPEEDAPARAVIDEAYAKLKAGSDFAELAASMSDCADKSGDLGTFPRGQMVEAFEEVVFNLEPGQHSDVFKTEFGWHVAIVHEKIPGQVTPLEEVKQQLSNHLLQQRHIEAIEGLIKGLKADSEIITEQA